MTFRLRAALVLVASGTLLAAAALARTTALTLGAFGALGVPCYAAAVGLYFLEVLKDLRRHDVL